MREKNRRLTALRESVPRLFDLQSVSFGMGLVTLRIWHNTGTPGAAAIAVANCHIGRDVQHNGGHSVHSGWETV